LSYDIAQSTTAFPLVFFMTDSSDHLTGKTGLTPTVTLSKNGGAFASPAGTVTEISAGWYKVAGNATDSATLGPLILHATGSGADATEILYAVIINNPQTALATAAALATLQTTANTIAGYIDTEVAAILAAVDTEVGSILTAANAIKVQTDKLTFTVANVLDANIQRINDVSITGNGQSGTEFNV